MSIFRDEISDLIYFLVLINVAIKTNVFVLSKRRKCVYKKWLIWRFNFHLIQIQTSFITSTSLSSLIFSSHISVYWNWFRTRNRCWFDWLIERKRIKLKYSNEFIVVQFFKCFFYSINFVFLIRLLDFLFLFDRSFHSRNNLFRNAFDVSWKKKNESKTSCCIW